MRPPRLLAVILLLATGLVSAVALDSGAAVAASRTDVRLTRAFYADPRMHAAVAAKKDHRFATLGRTPQAFWATDRYPVKSVRKVVRKYAVLANKKHRTPVVAVYAIPARDCGSHSAGTFSATTYKRWVRQVASGLRDQHAIVVLEPDAIAMMGDCAGQGNRAGLLAYATQKLAAARVWVYLDAGHSGWRSPADMADRLRRSGIRYARGFATNVGNYQTTATETTYARSVVAELTARKITRRHYLVETARNGAGPAANAESCNPPTARVGTRPRVVRKGWLDAYVWVKHPGESDGACNGGPNAGVWWPAGALRLLGR